MISRPLRFRWFFRAAFHGKAFIYPPLLSLNFNGSKKGNEKPNDEYSGEDGEDFEDENMGSEASDEDENDMLEEEEWHGVKESDLSDEESEHSSPAPQETALSSTPGVCLSLQNHFF